MKPQGSRLIAALSVLMMFILATAAAQPAQHFMIHFETGESALDVHAKTSLDSLISTLNNNPKAYKIQIIGHTDNVGSSGYNQSLSLKRAREVSKYFNAKGFTRTSCSGRSFNAPVADNMSGNGKALNRRVEVNIETGIPPVKSIGGLTLENNIYKIDASKGGTIEAASGTKVTIPQDAFVDKNGKAVKGNISVKYQEYRDPVDFILGNIPMSIESKGQLLPFNSAGMFKIEASQGKEPVYLAKSKSIQVDYAVTKDLPNLNFYAFDTIHDKWSELAKLNDEKGTHINEKWVVGEAVQWDHQIVFDKRENMCFLDKCDGIYYMVTAGIRYAGGKESLFVDPMKLDSMSKARNKLRNLLMSYSANLSTNKARIEKIQGSENELVHKYKVKQVSTAGNRTAFEIKCIANRKNEFAGMGNVQWICHGNLKEAYDSVFKSTWSDCRISRDKENYMIVLKNIDEQPLVIRDVQMTFTKRIKKKQRETVKQATYARYDSLARDYRRSLEAFAEKEKLVKENKLYSKLIDSVSVLVASADSIYKGMRRDSLYCLWEYSKEYMTPAEKKMNINAWALYFDKNKPKMMERYTALKSEPEYINCEEIGKANKERADQLVEAQKYNLTNNSELSSLMKIGASESNMKKGEDIGKTKAIFKSLAIQDLGVYNCDQVYALKAPVMTVNANYQDEQKKQLNIILLYVIDDSFNGIMRYDGFMGLSPATFKYSGSSNNTLIAFDEKFNAYICRANKVKEAASALTYTFTLERLTDVKSKNELE